MACVTLKADSHSDSSSRIRCMTHNKQGYGKASLHVLVVQEQVQRSGLNMKSKACLSAAATFGCQRSTLKMTRGPASECPLEKKKKQVQILG